MDNAILLSVTGEDRLKFHFKSTKIASIHKTNRQRHLFVGKHEHKPAVLARFVCAYRIFNVILVKPRIEEIVLLLP